MYSKLSTITFCLPTDPLRPASIQVRSGVVLTWRSLVGTALGSTTVRGRTRFRRPMKAVHRTRLHFPTKLS